MRPWVCLGAANCIADTVTDKCLGARKSDCVTDTFSNEFAHVISDVISDVRSDKVTHERCGLSIVV
jgi:hypothetical protein